MREIKFRTWHKELKSMEHRLSFKSMSIIDRYPEMYEVMQYTGLKDKNGKKIYERDVVTFFDNKCKKRISVIKWGKRKHGWVLKFYDKSFHAHDSKNRYYALHKNVEVIGNIYENHELLKG